MIPVLNDDVEGTGFLGHLCQKIGIRLTAKERGPSWTLGNMTQMFAFIVNTAEARLGVRKVRIPNPERIAPEDTDF